MMKTMKSRIGKSERNCERAPPAAGAEARGERRVGDPVAARDAPVSACRPVSSAGTVLSAQQRPITSRRTCPARGVGDDPLETLADLDRRCLARLVALTRGTSSTTMPGVPSLVADLGAWRRRPTCGRSRAPTSASSRSPIVGSVTTVISAPVALRSRVSRSPSAARGRVDDRREIVDEARPAAPGIGGPPRVLRQRRRGRQL